ncbi:hypothetical protein GCM10010385_16290 [Streptomyces geysiriensis]|nr:hypothetical protein GCM10010385_16290 [Streptomyces geysiriensis]
MPTVRERESARSWVRASARAACIGEGDRNADGSPEAEVCVADARGAAGRRMPTASGGPTDGAGGAAEVDVTARGQQGEGEVCADTRVHGSPDPYLSYLADRDRGRRWALPQGGVHMMDVGIS